MTAAKKYTMVVDPQKNINVVYIAGDTLNILRDLNTNCMHKEPNVTYLRPNLKPVHASNNERL